MILTSTRIIETGICLTPYMPIIGQWFRCIILSKMYTYFSYYNSWQANVRMLAEQQIKKKTKAYKNPIRLDRNTIKFEKDGMKPGVYYIEFTYSSEKPLLANFYFNAEVNHDPKSNTK